jgi:hypothetical protein
MLSADLESDWCRQRSIDMKNWGAGAGADSQVHFWSIHEGKTYEQSTNIFVGEADVFFAIFLPNAFDCTRGTSGNVRIHL